MTIQSIKKSEKHISMELSEPRLEKLNIIEDWFRKPSIEKAIPEVTKLAPTKASRPVLKELPADRMTRIVEIAMRNKAIQDLYEKACTTPTINMSGDTELGTWKIEFANDERTRAFGAYCNSIERRIVILPEYTDQIAMHQLVFELTNAVHAPKLQGLTIKAQRGVIGCEEFAKETERVEYEGLKIFNAIMCKLGWKNEDLSFLDSTEDNFEDHWLRMKNTAHSNQYRLNWSVLVRQCYKR